MTSSENSHEAMAAIQSSLMLQQYTGGYTTISSLVEATLQEIMSSNDKYFIIDFTEGWLVDTDNHLYEWIITRKEFNEIPFVIIAEVISTTVVHYFKIQEKELRGESAKKHIKESLITLKGLNSPHDSPLLPDHLNVLKKRVNEEEYSMLRYVIELTYVKKLNKLKWYQFGKKAQVEAWRTEELNKS